MPKDRKARLPDGSSPIGKYLVRCLGPGEEHTFLSTDTASHRLCPKCRDRIKGIREEYKNTGLKSYNPGE